MEIKTIFDGSEGEFITASQAAKQQERYLVKERERGNNDPVRAQFFGKEILSKMLETKGAVGIRIYHALGEDGEPNLVLVPTDANGKNLVQDTSGLKDMPDGADHGSNGPTCPKHC